MRGREQQDRNGGDPTYRVMHTIHGSKAATRTVRGLAGGGEQGVRQDTSMGSRRNNKRCLCHGHTTPLRGIDPLLVPA